MKRVLFYRNFKYFTGGHLKVWHYFNHVRQTPGYDARVSFGSETVWNETNPWTTAKDAAADSDFRPDLLFLAGRDWERLDPEQREHSPVPVINLIQHVRHADPAAAAFPFVRHKAIRICVSEEVREALEVLGPLRGPVFTIPNGFDIPPGLRDAAPSKKNGLLIVGLKQPMRARELEARLREDGAHSFYPVETLVDRQPRDRFLETVRHSAAAVFLPNPTEGFYLPALEAMAMNSLVICPDVVGNRTFCLPGVNCFRPDYEIEALATAVRQASAQTPPERFQMLENARTMAAAHTLEGERRRFAAVLEKTDELWRAAV